MQRWALTVRVWQRWALTVRVWQRWALTVRVWHGTYEAVDERVQQWLCDELDFGREARVEALLGRL